MTSLRIGEVARQAGVNLQTIHYYERRGLLAKPPRTGANYRAYPEEAVLRVRFIKRAQELLSLRSGQMSRTSPTLRTPERYGNVRLR